MRERASERLSPFRAKKTNRCAFSARGGLPGLLPPVSSCNLALPPVKTDHRAGHACHAWRPGTMRRGVQGTFGCKINAAARDAVSPRATLLCAARLSGVRALANKIEVDGLLSHRDVLAAPEVAAASKTYAPCDWRRRETADGPAAADIIFQGASGRVRVGDSAPIVCDCPLQAQRPFAPRVPGPGAPPRGKPRRGHSPSPHSVVRRGRRNLGRARGAGRGHALRPTASPSARPTNALRPGVECTSFAARARGRPGARAACDAWTTLRPGADRWQGRGRCRVGRRGLCARGAPPPPSSPAWTAEITSASPVASGGKSCSRDFSADRRGCGTGRSRRGGRGAPPKTPSLAAGHPRRALRQGAGAGAAAPCASRVAPFSDCGGAALSPKKLMSVHRPLHLALRYATRR